MIAGQLSVMYNAVIAIIVYGEKSCEQIHACRPGKDTLMVQPERPEGSSVEENPRSVFHLDL